MEVSDHMKEQIRRIEYYEAILTEAEEALRGEGTAKTDPGFVKRLRELSEYYGSSKWKEDFKADEAGLLPADLRRGVLSEDGIYNVLEEFEGWIEPDLEEAAGIDGGEHAKPKSDSKEKNAVRIGAVLLALVLVAAVAALMKGGSNVPDYDAPENWAYFGIGEDREADLFLLCPTVDTRDEFNMSLDDEKTRGSFLGALNMERGIYEESARMYAPYYRQAAMKVYSLDAAQREEYLQFAYRDVSAAFSYYLEHENNGRPIILAGFSQGADMCYRLLEEYFGDEELNSRLVAVYAIGWPCSDELVQKYPQIRPAQGADDIGTVISFDCEAPEVAETFITPAGSRAHTINPLNWRTDGTAADRSENLGACFTDYSGAATREEPGLCGCYIDESRGILKVTDVDPADYPAIVPGLPEGAYHIYDYQFFFRNLQENVSLRLDSYLEIRGQETFDDAA